MSYDRMKAKPIEGEHCLFCGDKSAPLVKTPCCNQWIHILSRMFAGEVFYFGMVAKPAKENVNKGGSDSGERKRA
jgi:hypothetical protein